MWSSIVGEDSGISNLLSDISQPFIDAWNAFAGEGTLWAQAVDYFKNIWSSIVGEDSGIANILTTISQPFIDAWSTISGTWDTVTGYFDGIWTSFTTTLTTTWETIQTTLGTTLDSISTKFTEIWDGIQTKVGEVVDGISTKVTTVWTTIKTTLTTLVDGIKTSITGTWDSLKASVSLTVDGIKSKIDTVFTLLKTSVTSTWNSIKSAITTPINAAKDKVKEVIDKIKGLFDFSNFHINTPHFKIEWSYQEFDMGILGKHWVNVPSLSVDWYAKAMKNGMILNDPTIFGMMDGKLLGAGEAGSETIVGTNSLMSMIQKAVASAGSTSNIDYGGITINVYGAEGQDVNALADVLEERFVMRIRQAKAGFA